MKIVRVTAVGLLVAAVLMNLGDIAFARWWLSSAKLHDWLHAVQAISPAVGGEAQAAGVPLIGLVTWGVMCLAVGLFVAGTVYSMFEDFVLETLECALEATAFVLEFIVRRAWRLVVKASRRTMVQS